MSNLNETIIYALPIGITIILGVFTYLRQKSSYELQKTLDLIPRINSESEITESNKDIEKLVLREDVELRILEEIVTLEEHSYYSFYSSRGKTKRERKLEEIQRQLRKVLKSSIEMENFSEIKIRIIGLLDQIENDLNEIRKKAPFEGLEDPERSLLIDLIEEIPIEKEIPRQKAHQLADILKVKHQDIKKLQLENAKSAGWTRWGTVGTVSFGLLSLALSIYTITT